MTWYLESCKDIDTEAVERATERQNSLTKPPGSLGQLEVLAIRLSGMLGDCPDTGNPAVVVFAADHGVADENVSAFPQVVTGEMVRNFANNGAAICVLSKLANASLEVVHLGTVNDPGPMPGVLRHWIAPASSNLSHDPAMSDEQLAGAMDAGRQAIERSAQRSAKVFVGGDMGIANTTSATALICAYLDLSAEAVSGPGTGLAPSGVAHKARVVQSALSLHRPAELSAEQILRRLGGFEIAALAGSYIAAAQAGMVCLVDGFITCAAALAAVKINPQVAPWMQLSHRSAEPGFGAVGDALVAAGAGAPLLDLGLRLGEGSGAALALPLLSSACRIHNDMATFAEAGVSGG